jgi:hypothetical protein
MSRFPPLFAGTGQPGALIVKDLDGLHHGCRVVVTNPACRPCEMIGSRCLESEAGGGVAPVGFGDGGWGLVMADGDRFHYRFRREYRPEATPQFNAVPRDLHNREDGRK